MKKLVILIIFLSFSASCNSSKAVENKLDEPSNKEKIKVMANKTNITFDCENAQKLLEHPASSVQMCQELLPGFFRVVLEGGDLTQSQIFRILWLDGIKIKDRGYKALGQYLQRIKIYEIKDLKTWPLGQLMETLEGLPPGFNCESLASNVDVETGESGSISIDPFVVTLIQPGYTPPTPKNISIKPGSPEPPGSPSDTPSLAPQDSPEFSPDPIQGYSPPVIGRARLLGDKNYKFTWKIEIRKHPGQPWEVVDEIALED